jgi:hypothetical protein
MVKKKFRDLILYVLMTNVFLRFDLICSNDKWTHGVRKMFQGDDSKTLVGKSSREIDNHEEH